MAQEEKKKSPAVTTLGRLIAHMVLDPVFHQRYLDEPEAVIAEAGLLPQEEAALRSGQWEQIKLFLGTGTRPLHEDPPHDPGGGG